MTECSICILAQRNSGSSVKVGYLWHGGMDGDWEYCYHCKGSGTEPMSGYQVVINHKIKQIEELTREELIVELISCIDRLEEVDILHSSLGEIMERFRNGTR